MNENTFRKIRDNISIYRQDVRTKGLYWSIIHRVYKIPFAKSVMEPIVSFTKPKKVRIGEHLLYIDKHDPVISQELLQSKTWEPYQSRLFIRYLKKGDTVLDIGAHIGYYTLLAAKKVGNKGHVYVFEPDPLNFKILEKNIQANGYTNVTPIRAAVSSKNGTTFLFQNKDNTGDHSITTKSKNLRKIRVRTVTLDDFFKEKCQADVIKIDIQGAEEFAIRGGKQTFKNARSLFIEFYPSALVESGGNPYLFLKKLRNLGFDLFDINETRRSVQKIIKYKEFAEKFSVPDPTGSSFTNLLCRKKEN